jgi:hypothetical protein
MNKQPQFNTLTFKTVVKACEMDKDMFSHIERWAKETFENKEKYRDEMVKFLHNFFKIKFFIHLK